MVNHHFLMVISRYWHARSTDPLLPFQAPNIVCGGFLFDLKTTKSDECQFQKATDLIFWSSTTIQHTHEPINIKHQLRDTQLDHISEVSTKIDPEPEVRYHFFPIRKVECILPSHRLYVGPESQSLEENCLPPWQGPSSVSFGGWCCLNWAIKDTHCLLVMK